MLLRLAIRSKIFGMRLQKVSRLLLLLNQIKQQIAMCNMLAALVPRQEKGRQRPPESFGKLDRKEQSPRVLLPLEEVEERHLPLPEAVPQGKHEKIEYGARCEATHFVEEEAAGRAVLYWHAGLWPESS